VTVVLTRRRKRRREIAEPLQALVDTHPHECVFVAWDNLGTHQNDEIEAVVRGAAARFGVLCLLTYSPWLNTIEVLWRWFRGEVTHCALFADAHSLLTTTRDIFDRYNRTRGGVRSILGAHPA
jgi:putative transposase